MIYIINFWIQGVQGKQWMSRTSLFFKMMAAKKSRMNTAPLKGGNYGKWTKNWFRIKELHENLYILAELETKSNAYQMIMLKHCIPKMPNFTKNEDANDMQSVIVKIKIYCSKQTWIIWAFQTSLEAPKPNESFNSFVATLCDIIHKRKCCMHYEESVLQDNSTFGI